ncbi:phage tail protein [Dactylosporangium sp. NPDC051485]|uniref:phage tail protein n=1 Tax=Dactylosporangium sp. NPDC051485 TaxID=3154846 RepID=UPI00342D5927
MSYLDHLPATFRQGDFLGRFLLAFEAVLDGAPDVNEVGLQPRIDGLSELFDPAATPTEFLPWLAGWVALSLRADFNEATVRGFLREVVPLYRQRGTLGGLRRVLRIYMRPLSPDSTADNVAIYDDFVDPPHYFQVKLTLHDGDPDRLRRTQQVARAIIDLEKPAHTFYALKVVVPTMRLVSVPLREAEHDAPALLILGQNTWLGTAEQMEG